MFKCLQTLDIEVNSFTARSGACCRDSVCCLDDSSLQSLWLCFGGMVRDHCMDDFWRFTKTACNFASNNGMRPFDLLVNGFAHIMKQGSSFANVHICP